LLFLVISKITRIWMEFLVLRFWFIPIVIVLLLIMIIGGWIEDMAGMWGEEQKYLMIEVHR